MSCFCCSSLSFEECCQPIINGSTAAETPLQLMRSRYSAYVTKNAEYIYNTYSSITRHKQSIEEISEWSTQCRWLKLIIHSSSSVTLATYQSADDSLVCFTAIYQQQGSYYQMKEESRFTVEGNRWFYLDGNIIVHEELIPPKRNELCFCGSEKKFKKCCGR